MPQSIAAHASTQDNVLGTPVAQAFGEVNNGAIMQTMVPEGNKSTYVEVGRTGITIADTGVTLTALGLCDLGNALSIEIRAICDTSGQTMSTRLILYDNGSHPLAMSDGLSFTSDSVLTYNLSGVWFPCTRQIIDAGQARYCKPNIDTISGGVWNIYTRPI